MAHIFNRVLFIQVNNMHEKLLDSDWLGAVEFMCNTSAKSVTPVETTHRNSGI